ncbi:universal stress protein [Desulfococcaceae bacterium HSG8]|nr:universal stress protein [Desulfococcaceae bacterium HSG8]
MEIMVCYDQSDAAKEALKVAEKHAEAFGAKVYVVTSMIGGREVPRDEFANAERELKYAENVLKEDKITCETKLLVRGLSPGEDLTLFANENNIDEIIIGIKKKSKVGKLLLGSTAQYVIMKAECPVVAVK